MTPYETYTKYLALKQHFTTESYDYFKYGGKVRVKMETFEKRHDKYFFYKLSKKKNVEEFLVANFIDNNSSWVGSLSQDKASEDIYAAWKKRQESLGYLYKSDIEKIEPPLDSVLKVEDGNYPKLLMMYKRGEVMIETIIILNQLVKFIPHWDKNINDTVLWPATKEKILKYAPFVKFDIFKFKKLTIDYFS